MSDDVLIDNKAKMKIMFWLKVIAIALLLLSLVKLPYGYYTFLRIFITGTALFSAFIYYKKQQIFWLIVMVLITILFNPIIPIHFRSETWKLIDMCTVLVLLICIFAVKEYKMLKK